MDWTPHQGEAPFGRHAPLPLGDLPGTRYPSAAVEALDKRFTARQGNAAIQRIATGFRWAEGPVYFADGGYLLWSDIPNNRIMRWLEDDGPHQRVSALIATTPTAIHATGRGGWSPASTTAVASPGPSRTAASPS